MCEWDSKWQCLSAYKNFNENSVVTLYLYETKLTRIIKFCSILFIYAHSFETGVCSCERYGPYASCFLNLSLWVCIIHNDMGVGRVGVGVGVDECLVHARLLLISGCCCSYMFFFRSNSPPPPFTWKKRKNSKNCKLRIYRIWWPAFFFFSSLVFQSFPNHTSVV